MTENALIRPVAVIAAVLFLVSGVFPVGAGVAIYAKDIPFSCIAGILRQVESHLRAGAVRFGQNGKQNWFCGSG